MSVRRLASADQQPPAFAFTAENERWLAQQIAKYPDGRQASAVIPALWQAQKQNDYWLPRKAIEAVAETLGMPMIRVMEVATFYTMFNLEPVGRFFVQLCGTVPCHVKGAIDLKQALLNKVGDERHVSADGNFSWLEVECLGACCNAPMVQINDDYYEDLTPDLLVALLDDLAAGRPVKVGPQNGRHASEPEGAVTTLQDPALYDGSVVGTWRDRFRDDPVATGETEAATATGPGDPKPAKPDAGRATERPVTDTPATRAAQGEAPVHPETRADSADSAKKTQTDEAPSAEGAKPQSDKSYTATPSKPAEGRPVAGAGGTTPVAGTPPSEGAPRAEPTKPVGADPDASPGRPPKE